MTTSGDLVGFMPERHPPGVVSGGPFPTRDQLATGTQPVRAIDPRPLRPFEYSLFDGGVVVDRCWICARTEIQARVYAASRQIARRIAGEATLVAIAMEERRNG